MMMLKSIGVTLFSRLSNSDIDTDIKNTFSFEKYNSFEKLIRNTSFISRFIDNMKLKVENKNLVVGNLTLDKSKRTKCLLIKNEQKVFLGNNKIKEELANNLSEFLDKKSLLRVKRRLLNSLLPCETKFPILLKCYLRYKTIFSHKVYLDVQLINLFI